jgi:hypothetical protein
MNSFISRTFQSPTHSSPFVVIYLSIRNNVLVIDHVILASKHNFDVATNHAYEKCHVISTGKSNFEIATKSCI